MLSVEPLTHDDLSATADLHRQNLKLGLFPKLGRHFLGLYQESFSRSPHGIALVARSEDEVVGALFGTISNAEHFRWVTRHMGPQLALAGSGAMLMRPQLAFDFARTRLGRYTRGLARHLGVLPAASSSSGGPGRPLSVLSHIVTAQTARRRGIGRKLVDEFKARASAKGVHRALLVTEEGGMGSPFFERIGCSLVARRQGEDGAVLREYRLILDEAGAYEEMDRNRSNRIVVHPYPERLGTVRPLAANIPEHR